VRHASEHVREPFQPGDWNWGAVNPQREAKAAGMKVADAVLAVNGHPIDGLIDEKRETGSPVRRDLQQDSRFSLTVHEGHASYSILVMPDEDAPITSSVSVRHNQGCGPSQTLVVTGPSPLAVTSGCVSMLMRSPLALPSRSRASILGRMLRTVDHEKLDDSLFALQFEPRLFDERGEQVRSNVLRAAVDLFGLTAATSNVILPVSRGPERSPARSHTRQRSGTQTGTAWHGADVHDPTRWRVRFSRK
jgi:hypothetical protein